MKNQFLAGSVIFCGIIWPCFADTIVFKDVQRPHGRERSMAVKEADGIKCGWTRDGRVLTSEDQMLRCMRSLGWKVSNYIPSAETPTSNTIAFTDLSRGGTRGQAGLDAASKVCDPGHRLNSRSKTFQACMRKQGWGYYNYTPPSARDADEDASASSSPDVYASPDISPTPPPPTIDVPAAPYESPPAPDIHPFCPNTIC